MNLNELEYANGKVYANVWLQLYIRNHAHDRQGLKKSSTAQASSKRPKRKATTKCSTAIAYDPKAGTFFITGKNWQYMLRYDGNRQLATGNW